MEKFIKFSIIVGVLFLGMKVFGIGPFGGGGGRNYSLVLLQEQAEAEGKDKIVILLTGTKWCPACKELDRDVISTPEWTAFTEEEVVFASYNYGPTERPRSGTKGEMLSTFMDEGFPTLIVLDSDGKVLAKQAGYRDGGNGYYQNWIKSL